jgi:exodeoxyribonuclease VII large subunit
VSYRGEGVAPVAGTEVRPGSREAPYPVSTVVRGAGRVLDREVGTIWVEGETTSVSRSARGPIYFCLKDSNAQLPAVLWARDARALRFRMEDGLHLRCRGRLDIYQASGKFQMIVGMAEPAGLGAEALRLEQLKQTLAAEGLFDPARKRPLPRLPRRIGVVTSRSGAAVRDIVRAVQRRYPVPILIADTRVQGQTAPKSIAKAIADICTTDVDVVIIGRGGGSAADLEAFNHEAVVRAVAACSVPTISAVGHEVDISLTDLVADVRAATPTMAGEMAVPVLADLAAALRKEEQRLDRELGIHLRQARQDLDRADTALEVAVGAALTGRRHHLGELRRRLEGQHPRSQLIARRGELRELEGRASSVLTRRMDGAARSFGELTARLESLSPLSVLSRGYALATSGGHVVTDAAALNEGDALEVRLARGEARCRVEEVIPEPSGSILGAGDGAGEDEE